MRKNGLPGWTISSAGPSWLNLKPLCPIGRRPKRRKQAARKLKAVLKRELSPSRLTNEDFFSHQLRERIGREQPSPSGGGSGWWTIPRLVWSGATAIALFIVCAVFVMNDEEPMDYSDNTSKHP